MTGNRYGSIAVMTKKIGPLPKENDENVQCSILSKVKDKHIDCYMFFQFDPLFGNYNVTLVGT